jgi:hypothetical protein
MYMECFFLEPGYYTEKLKTHTEAIQMRTEVTAPRVTANFSVDKQTNSYLYE